jgi:hypothetical protein
MLRMLKTFGGTWMLRSGLLLMLVVGMGLAPVAQAAAPAVDNSVSEITVYAPGAALGSPVAVQYIDVSGHWVNVTGWTGVLDRETDNLLVPFKQFTVFKPNFGQGPFRWVIYQMDGKTVWGISDNFSLPPGGGINQTETVAAGANVAGGAPTATPVAPAATPAPATPTPSAPAPSSLQFTNTGLALFHMNCSDCSAISGYFLGVPATAWITVQWGDGLGHYTTVTGWEGVADDTDSTTGQLIKHFTFGTSNLGQGPFRWAVYDAQGGTLLGFSGDFTLPSNTGQNLFMSFAK